MEKPLQLRFLWDGLELQKYILEEIKNIKEIKISTAYFSSYGLEIIRSWKEKWNLNRSDIEILLSSEFNVRNPSKLLQELNELAKVYIIPDPFLHAKVYSFYGPDSYICHGSSNLTRGGYENNIEFNSVQKLSKEMEFPLRRFFEQQLKYGLPATDEIITQYELLQSDLDEVKKKRKQIFSSLFKSFQSEDPFSKDAYDLYNHYFQYEDYQVFFPRNKKKPANHPIQKSRKRVKEKLLAIHKVLEPELEAIGLYSHRNPKFTTSHITPNNFNKERVGWIGIRYGKHKDVVDKLNGIYGINRYDRKKDFDESFSFQKHACIQLAIGSHGIDISLFHAVADEAVDRDHLDKKLLDSAFKEEVTNYIGDLRERGYVWDIYDPKSEEIIASFKLDQNRPEDFLDFYRKNDEKGFESFLKHAIPVNDIRIQSIESIVDLVIEKANELLPLYHAIARTKV
ncbi:phospholipase D-like domain-containing protein [Bacillus cereus]|uniref:phospholipase D-like domain-containing protein n=1 Tax=Bacillus cereus TaxID=1396 RepID=UPI0018F567F8|nr:hypothetical protein [Bacillus cereus]